MRYSIAEEARPQVRLLVFAMLASVGIWAVSWFLPAAAYVVYPLQLFATFVHEGSHALVTLITGNEVQSLTVSPDGSGVVWSRSSGFSSLLISSAGYLGTTLFGIALLVWIRRGYSSKAALYALAGLTAFMTVVFGLVAPIYNLLSNVSFLSVVFTVSAGIVLSAVLAAIARFTSSKWTDFALAFLAVQCLLNAFFSLKDLFIISTTTEMGSDAANMAAVTFVPAVVWVILWTGISVGMLAFGLRLYATRKKAIARDSVFDV